MEVLSFFSDNKYLIQYFNDFINNYSKLKLDVKDNDTAYFINPLTGKNEIYFHFLPNNVDDEFQYNYSEEEKKKIKLFFKKETINMFDIQYKNEFFVKEMLDDFKAYLNNIIGYSSKILISHPFNGLVIW